MGHHVVDGLAQAANFLLDLIGSNRPIFDFGEIPAEDQRRCAGDSRRDSNPSEDVGHWTVSPKPVATKSTKALAACSASGPLARMVIELPHSAASIITPMMLLPFTPTPSLQISMSELKVLASRTMRAAGRAWRPSRLTIVASRSITGRAAGTGEEPPWP